MFSNLRMLQQICVVFVCLYSFSHGFISHRVFEFVGRRLDLRRQMFSGIIEEIGEVVAMEFNRTVKMWDGSVASGLEMVVRSNVATEDAYIGCSIAVNGVCLTATELENNQFSVAVSPETIRRTNLGKLQPGSHVNIERALQPNGRNSGHFVQGHVDCTAKILDKWFEGDSLWVKLGLDDEFIRYIVPKGFVSLDGTSLTICDVHSKPQNNWFTIMLVPHTQQSVIFPAKEIGEEVNVEVDILGKLVERSLTSNFERIQNQVSDFTKNLLEKDQKIEHLSQVLDELKRKIEAIEASQRSS